MNDTDQFCAKCGANQTNDTNQNRSNDERIEIKLKPNAKRKPHPEKKNKNSKVFLFTSIPILLIIIFFGIFFLLQNNNNSNTKPESDSTYYIDDNLYSDTGDEENIEIDESGIQYYNNELRLYVKENTEQNKVETLAKELNANIVGKNTYLNTYLLRINKTYTYSELNEIISNITKEDFIDDATHNLTYSFEANAYTPTSKADRWSDNWDTTPSGPNWGMEAINAPEAWEYIDLMKKVNVGVFDTGFYTEHEDLRNVINSDIICTNDEHDTNHGTHVAGILGAEFENGIGVNGVAPTAVLNVIDTISAFNHTSGDGFAFALTNLIEVNHSKVINISLGTHSEYLFAASKGVFEAQELLKAMALDIEKTLTILRKNNDNDFVICTSAGNECDDYYYKNDDAPYGYYLAGENNTYLDRETNKYLPYKGIPNIKSGKNQVQAKWHPIALIDNEDLKSRIIVVGAIQNDSNTSTPSYSVCDFSNIGERVDVVAPGYDIESTVSNNNYEWQYTDEDGTTFSWAGTSMASPHVAGIATMLYSLEPNISGNKVKKIICDTATTNVDGFKLVDAATAIKEVLGKGILSGKVVADSQNAPLFKVKIEAYLKLKSGSKLTGTVFTTSNGVFSIELPSGDYEIKVIAVGFDTYSTTTKITKDNITTLDENINLKISNGNQNNNIQNNTTNNTTNNTSYEYGNVIKNPFGEYYLSGSVTVNLADTGEFNCSSVTYDNEADEMILGGLHPYSTAYDGESFYGRIADNDTLFKTSFDSKSHTNAKTWVSNTNLSNMGLRAACMYLFQADGDYIYFSYQPTPEYFQTELENAYKLGRISKDGKDIYLYDEIASSYAVKDGWIYYYNNGYVYNNNSKSYSYKSENAGLYKMKVDGSGKRTLKNGFVESSKETTDAIRCCDKLKIYGDYLYYLDYSESGKSRVCKMNFDGKQVEYISANGAFNYAVNTENNILYYSTGELGLAQLDKRTLYQLNMTAGEEKSLLKLSYGNIDFSVYNNKLYFFDYNFTLGNNDTHRVSGMRYDIQNEKLQNLMGYYDIQDINDGIFTERVRKGPYFYWEDAAIEN